MSLVDIDVAIRVILLRSLGAIFDSGDHIDRLDHDVSWVHSCHRRQVVIRISASQELLEGRQRLVWSRIEMLGFFIVTLPLSKNNVTLENL